MPIRKVIGPESVHGNGSGDKVAGIKGRERNHLFFIRMMCMVFICFMLLLAAISFCVGEAEAITTSGWESEKALIDGTGYFYGGYGIPSIAFNVTGDGRWTLISGAFYGEFYGYYWDGTNWIRDNSRVSALGDIGYCSAPALVFDLIDDRNWTLIARNSAGIFYGYYWNGTEWTADSSRVAGLDVIQGKAGLTIIDNLTGDGNWTLISGDEEGTFNGYYWNGAQWVSDSSRVNGLGDVGSYSRVTASFNVTGDENWTLITGNRAGTFSGYYWNGTQWISDTSRAADLGDIGSYSAPTLAFNLTGYGKWILISGSEYFGYKDGFMYNTVKTETLKPITDASHINILATTAHINWTYDRTWDHRVEYSTNPDLSDSQWSDWQIDADVIDIKLWNLQPNTTYYYRAYTYVPWNTSYYIKSSVNTFTAISSRAHIYVNPGDSIRDAIDTLLPEGGTVELLPGVHDVYDTIVINKGNITIKGTHKSEIKSHHSNKDIFVFYPKNRGPGEPWDTMPKLANFLFKGFKVNSTYAGGSFVSAWNVNNITIEDILDVSPLSHFITINPTGGGTTARSEGIFVRNNTIYHSGVCIYYSKNIHILNNTLEGPKAVIGIFRDNKDIRVIGNRVNNHGGSYACLIVEGHYWEVYDNVFEGNKFGIRLTVSPSNVIVRNNTVTGATEAGIQLCYQIGMRNITIANNRVYDNEGHGILTSEHLTTHRCGEVSVTNNVINNNAGDGVRMTTECMALNIFNNIITKNTGYGINHMAGNISHSYNDVWGNMRGSYNNTTAGIDDISADPLFVDAANSDFRLKSTSGHWNGSTWVDDDITSPCIDAGNPASDYSKEQEPNGGRINMGAYGNTREASKSPTPPIITAEANSNFLNGLLCSNCLYIPLINLLYFRE